MFVNPTYPGRFGSVLDTRQKLAARHESGEFDDILQGLVGDYDRASQATVDKIWRLRAHQSFTQARWKDGQFGIHIEDVTNERNKLLKAFTEAADALFADYGIDTSQRIAFNIDANGNVIVTSPHRDQSAIETLVNGSGLMRNAIAKLLNDSHLVAIAAQGPSVSTVDLQQIAQGLGLVMREGPEGLVGDVVVGDDVVASSTDKDLHDDLAALDAAIRYFDAAHRQLAIAQREELERLKVQDGKRRTADDLVRKAELAERLAEKEAAERMARLHPELGHRPVFI